MEDIRRKSLISATLKTIQERRSIDIRVSDIARAAGVSSGLAHHYFGSKDRLILAALRHLLTDFRRLVLRRLAEADSPRQKLSALIASSLDETQFSDATVTAWLVFYAHAQSTPEARNLLRVYVRRLQSNLCYNLRPLVGNRAPEIAEMIGSLIDGLYLRQALRVEKADAAFARTLIENCLNRFLDTAPMEGQDHAV
ncbi:HTH-type transcriptional regulator BetI [Sneathiella chinensis]|uniref:HTH-type transcriptional regulator BetI n=2 Tax=Sneathiella chinensis TaxID=349750 RepID=A0ABQ5U4U5_9PROT|nr:HTH-type transcriptional regulator BetI [Sneathiella chinensis]